MRRRATWLGLLAAVALGAFAPVAAKASSEAGIEITVGTFTLRVLYSVALDYPEQSRAIRDPSSVLFDLATVIQANAERFAAIDHEFIAELTIRDDSPTVLLDVGEDAYDRPSRDYVRVAEIPARDVAVQIVAALCIRYPSACAKPSAREVTLYACEKAPCPGQISFGAFPSTGLNRRYALLPPKGVKPRSIAVTREGMRKHFGVLDD